MGTSRPSTPAKPHGWARYGRYVPVPVLRSARGRHAHERSQDRALRRRSSERKLQLDGLAQRPPGELCEDRRCAHVVLSTARGPGDGHAHATSGLETRRQRAAIESIETRTAPPPARKRERNRQQTEPASSTRGGPSAAEQRGHDQSKRGLCAHHVRGCEPQAERAGKQPRHLTEDQVGHGATNPRSCSSRAGPIPAIASSSSTEPKAPCCCR